MTLLLGAYTETVLPLVQSVCHRLPGEGRGRNFGLSNGRKKAHLTISFIPMAWTIIYQTNICFLYAVWVALCQDRMGMIISGMCIHDCYLIQGTIIRRVRFLIKSVTSRLFFIISNILFYFLIFRMFSKDLKVCSIIALKEFENVQQFELVQDYRNGEQ